MLNYAKCKVDEELRDMFPDTLGPDVAVEAVGECACCVCVCVSYILCERGVDAASLTHHHTHTHMTTTTHNLPRLPLRQDDAPHDRAEGG